MNDESAEMLGTANDSFLENFRNPLVRRGGFPQQMNLSSTEDALHGVMVQAAGHQLAAADTPPELTGKHDLALRVHETMIANFSEARWGGVTQTDEQLQKMVKDLTGRVPEALEISEDDDPWSITFANERPIEMAFDDQQINVVMRGRRFKSGRRSVKNVVLSATYNVVTVDGKTQLVREGDVASKFDDDQGFGVAMKPVIEAKAEGLFQPQIDLDELTLPGEWEKVGKLALQQLDCGNNWLTLGWLLPDQQVRTARRD
jgi:hypothetical protein